MPFPSSAFLLIPLYSYLFPYYFDMNLRAELGRDEILSLRRFLLLCNMWFKNLLQDRHIASYKWKTISSHIFSHSFFITFQSFFSLQIDIWCGIWHAIPNDISSQLWKMIQNDSWLRWEKNSKRRHAKSQSKDNRRSKDKRKKDLKVTLYLYPFSFSISFFLFLGNFS